MALIAHWPLNGDTKDYSGYGNHGVNNGVMWVDGKIGQAASFNVNNSSGVNIQNNNFTNIGANYTFSVWLRIKGNHRNYNGTIISSGNWNSQSWSFGVNQNNTAIDVAGNGYNRWISYTLPINEWFHLTSVRTTNGASVYINGELIGTRQVDQIKQSSDMNTYIGRETYAGGYFSFNGDINDLRIYNHALSAKEVKKLSQGLIVHYNFNDSYDKIRRNLIFPNVSFPYTSNGLTVDWDDINHIMTIDGTASSGFNMRLSNKNLPPGIRTASVYHIGGSIENWSSTAFRFSSQSIGATYMYLRNNDLSPKTYEDPTTFNACQFWIASGTKFSNYRIKMQIERGDKASKWSPPNSTLYEPGDNIILKDQSGFKNTSILIDDLNENNYIEISDDTEISDSSIKISSDSRLRFESRYDLGNLEIKNTTISFWTKPSQLSGRKMIVGTANGSNQRLYIGTGNGSDNTRWDFGIGNKAWSTGSEIHSSLERWDHILLTSNGTETFMYINGKYSHKKEHDNFIINFPFYIGNASSGSKEYQYNGYISDFRIYRTFFSDEDILELYQERSSFDDHGNIHTYHIEQDVHASRNLVLNGYGEMGDNSYFTNMDFDPDTRAFSATSRGTYISSQRIPISHRDDMSYDRYEIKAETRQREGQLSRYYMMIAYYDKDGRRIGHQHIYNGPEAEILKEVRNGDTEIKVSFNSPWYNSSPGTYVHQKQIRVFPPGHEYDAGTYSRIIEQYKDINGDTLILNKPWSSGTLPAGSTIVNTRSGGDYNYMGASNAQMTRDWKTISGVTTGVIGHGGSDIRYGATHMTIGFLLNRDVSETVTTEIRNMSIVNIDSPQTLSDKFSVSEKGSINPGVIDQINHDLNESSDIKQRIREDGTLEMAGYIIQK